MRLRQWFCRGPHDNEYIFTPSDCDPDTALAIAWATFGRASVGTVVDEGLINQESQTECAEFINELAREPATQEPGESAGSLSDQEGKN